MKTRQRWLIVIAAALLLTTTVIVLPQIIGAKRSTELPAEKSLSVAPVPMRSTGQNEKSSVIVGASVHNDTSPPLREMKQEKVAKKVEHEANENPKVPASLKHKDSPDTAVQSASSVAAFAGLNMPSPLLNFDGIAFPGVACNCAPPDTNGEVGATQYVQIVNEGFQVFDKTTGASLLGPSGITTLWSGFGGVCQNNGSGDPVVLYDQIANRWVITQFAGVSVPTDECIAVSTTSDATGSFNRYDFHLGSNFFDYPHLSVWPDAYYMSMNVFNSAGTAFLGPQPFAFDRTKMLLGLPATFVSTYPLLQPRRGRLFAALRHDAELRAPTGHYQQGRWHWRPFDVPPGLSKLWRPRSGRGELQRELGRCVRSPLVRAAQRDLRTSNGFPGEHLPTGHYLALDGQRGNGPAGKSRRRLQRFELIDQPADPLRRAAL